MGGWKHGGIEKCPLSWGIEKYSLTGEWERYYLAR